MSQATFYSDNFCILDIEDAIEAFKQHREGITDDQINRLKGKNDDDM